MVGIRRWGEEVTFSFSPLNRLGFQAQEVRAGGNGNTGSRGLACCALPAATSTWRLQVLERGQGGGRFSPVFPSPPPPSPYTWLWPHKSLGDDAPWAHWLPPEPSGSMGEEQLCSSPVHTR